MTIVAKEGKAKVVISPSLEKVRAPGAMMIEQPKLPKPKKLLSDEMVRKYQGKLIALTSTGPKAVIASADDYGSLIALVKKLNVSRYLVIPVPRMGVAYSH
jgi:hypothetical protein